jgi:hypothetical protein
MEPFEQVGRVMLGIAAIGGVVFFASAFARGIARGILDSGRDAKSQPVDTVARVLVGFVAWVLVVSGLAFGLAFGGWVGGWPALLTGGLAFGRTCLVFFVGGPATYIVLSIAAFIATQGGKRFRLARAGYVQQRAYAVATVVWSLVVASVGAGVSCLGALLVQRAFLRRGMSLVDALHIPDALVDVAHSTVLIGFWPLVIGGMMLAWLGFRMPPID